MFRPDCGFIHTLIPPVLVWMQHFVFGIGRFIDFAVPDVPESLKIKIKSEAYLAKQALQQIQVRLL